MNKEFKPLSYIVKYFDCNGQRICDYDVLKYRQDFIKKLKKKCATKEEFADKLSREFRWAYWSKCEWELIIEITEEGRIWLNPWAGCYEPEKVRIDVTDATDFDWKGFADRYIDKRYRNKEKIDVWDQIEFQFEELVTRLWTTRLKYERDDPKFHK